MSAHFGGRIFSFGIALFEPSRFLLCCRGLCVASVVMCASFGVGACADQTQSSVTDLPTSLGVSGTQSSESGGQKITADVVMSGEYEVGPDGRLLRPKDSSVVLPPLPDAAREFSEEGAYAFSEYWLQVMAYSWNSGNAQALQNLSEPSCIFCRTRVSKMQEFSSEGNWIQGMEYKVNNRVQNIHFSENLYAALLEVESDDFTVYSHGNLTNGKQDAFRIELQVCWKKDHWMMCGGAVDDDKPQSK